MSGRSWRMVVLHSGEHAARGVARRAARVTADDGDAQRAQLVAESRELRVGGAAEAVRPRVVDVDQVEAHRQAAEVRAQRRDLVAARVDAAEDDPGDGGAAADRLLIITHRA